MRSSVWFRCVIDDLNVSDSCLVRLILGCHFPHQNIHPHRRFYAQRGHPGRDPISIALLLGYHAAMTQRHPILNDVLMFVTTNTLARRPIFADPAYASEAIDCLYRLQTVHPFFLFGFVIMPDHCHFLLNVPAPYTIAKLMNAYKTGLTFDIGIGSLWQARYDLRVPDDG